MKSESKVKFTKRRVEITAGNEREYGKEKMTRVYIKKSQNEEIALLTEYYEDLEE